jgi:hypothetical protein
MSPEEARRRLALKKMPKGQAFGRAVNHERAEARYRKVLECAEAGMTLAQAASATGLKPDGVETMLWRKLGSTTWPPKAGAA